VIALLSACATGEAARTLRGQAGRVAWEIVDIEQTLEDRGFLMRRTFTIVLRNPSDSFSTVSADAARVTFAKSTTCVARIRAGSEM
jgi:hypothetical protein